MNKRNRSAYRLGITILLAAFLCVLSASALADSKHQNLPEDCFGFFATEITFKDDRVIVQGYFYNFTLDRVIHDISELEVEIYDANDKVICYGNFSALSDSLNALKLSPGYSSLQVFEFNSTARNPGDYDLSFISAGIMCSFVPSSY